MEHLGAQEPNISTPFQKRKVNIGLTNIRWIETQLTHSPYQLCLMIVSYTIMSCLQLTLKVTLIVHPWQQEEVSIKSVELNQTFQVHIGFMAIQSQQKKHLR